MGQILHLTSAIRLAAKVKPFSLISRSKFSSSRYDTVTHFTPNYSAFEIRAEQMHRQNHKMGIGIRHKRHWVTAKTSRGHGSTLGEVTNSIHLYYGLHRSFDGHSWFNRFDIGASLGGLVDLAEPSLSHTNKIVKP